MIARAEQVIPITPDADHTGLEGYFIDIDGGESSLSDTVTVAPFGVILEGGKTNGKDSIATPGFGGTVKVKVTGTAPGAIVLGSGLKLAAEDGTVKLDGGTGGGVRVAIALEAGAANELIEARLVEPQVLS